MLRRAFQGTPEFFYWEGTGVLRVWGLIGFAHKAEKKETLHPTYLRVSG